MVKRTESDQDKLKKTCFELEGTPVRIEVCHRKATENGNIVTVIFSGLVHPHYKDDHKGPGYVGEETKDPRLLEHLNLFMEKLKESCPTFTEGWGKKSLVPIGVEDPSHIGADAMQMTFSLPMDSDASFIKKGGYKKERNQLFDAIAATVAAAAPRLETAMKISLQKDLATRDAFGESIDAQVHRKRVEGVQVVSLAPLLGHAIENKYPGIDSSQALDIAGTCVKFLREQGLLKISVREGGAGSPGMN